MAQSTCEIVMKCHLVLKPSCRKYNIRIQIQFFMKKQNTLK